LPRYDLFAQAGMALPGSRPILPMPDAHFRCR
jgi:hypothetical protein